MQVIIQIINTYIEYSIMQIVLNKMNLIKEGKGFINIAIVKYFRIIDNLEMNK